jgi:hypothetical protein
MKKAVFGLLAVALLLAGSLVVRPSAPAQADSPIVLKFGNMVGVPKAYTGSAFPLRGLNGGGLPWVISSAQGVLSQSGMLVGQFQGLVLDPNDPTVISRGLAGVNPIAEMKAVVSCRSLDANGNPNVVNVSSDPFPVTTGAAVNGGGDAQFQVQVSLPSVCIAPVVFITSTGGAWFAATGF